MKYILCWWNPFSALCQKWTESGFGNPSYCWPLPAGKCGARAMQREAFLEEVAPGMCAVRMRRYPRAPQKSLGVWCTGPSAEGTPACDSPVSAAKA